MVLVSALWLWHGDSLGTQEGEHPPLEAGTRGLVTKKTKYGCCELQTDCVK
jgi:hypothetical protein